MLFIGALSLLCALLYFLQLDATLAFRRDEITQGQWWRLLTGNFLHTNLWHLVMNLGGLWVMYLLHGFHFNLKGYLLLILSLSLLEGLGLFLLYPGLHGYVGLSGILHGIFAFGAVQDIRTKYRSGWLLLVGVIAKVTYEQIYGASQDVTALIGARVATESHLIGLCAGLLCALLFLGYQKRFTLA